MNVGGYAHFTAHQGGGQDTPPTKIAKDGEAEGLTADDADGRGWGLEAETAILDA